MPALILGPLLRHAGETDALVWAEADAPCTVEVLGCAAATFAVAGHHFALVHVTGLEPGAAVTYEVALDGEVVWPLADTELPPSIIDTRLPDDDGCTVAFGSCRTSQNKGPDALSALAERMADDPQRRRPDLLLLLGDQVYADELSRDTRARLRERRDVSVPPGESVADFEEYTWLYQEAWSEPTVRWLLSTVPVAMIFDDHEVHDDWNASRTWVEQMRAKDWWGPRLEGALMSYWCYQHLGNLPPGELEGEAVLEAVRAVDGDAAPVLREHVRRAADDPTTARWSFARDVGCARVLVVDSRAGRQLEPGRRAMLDEAEWTWMAEQVAGAGARHLLVGSSLPIVGPHAIHYAEAWNEAVCDGVWGQRAAGWGERMRQAMDLEHWPAFQRSFTALFALLGEVGAGRHGPPPATITLLSGDVHFGYLARVAFPRAAGVRCAVWQATCSPMRNPLPPKLRMATRRAFGRTPWALWRALARAAGVGDPPVRWRFEPPSPWFGNQLATVRVEGPRADVTFEQVREGGLRPVLQRSLDSGGSAAP
ncbi:MAG: alkaline phosphatase family protein [Actinomycetota bacterium]|nr:alkaline phosphatase family protein [Actinomycetota bacterium]